MEERFLKRKLHNSFFLKNNDAAKDILQTLYDEGIECEKELCEYENWTVVRDFEDASSIHSSFPLNNPDYILHLKNKEKYYICVFDFGVYFINEIKQYHRLNFPAVQDVGQNLWFKNDKLHRVDGPCFVEIKSDFKKWAIDGQEMTESEFIKEMAKRRLKICTKK